jgi:hypothetical protein
MYQSMRQVYESGYMYEEVSMKISLARTADGGLEDRCFTYIQQARYDKQGCIDGVLAFGFEVTPPVQANSCALPSTAQHLVFKPLMPCAMRLSASWISTGP